MRCRGGFIFVDFTLACCQPKILTLFLFPNYEGDGTSLLSNVGDRTCEEAEIPESYCRCQDGVKDLTGKQASDLATAIILDINNFLASFTFCNILDLDKVEGGSFKFLANIDSVRSSLMLKVGGNLRRVFLTVLKRSGWRRGGQWGWTSMSRPLNVCPEASPTSNHSVFAEVHIKESTFK